MEMSSLAVTAFRISILNTNRVEMISSPPASPRRLLTKPIPIPVQLPEKQDQKAAPWVSLLDDAAKIVTSRLDATRFRVTGTTEYNGYNRDIRAERIDPLIAWCRANFPGMSTRQSVPWTGLRPIMPNMLPRVGRGRNPRVYYNTGHGHLGWTLSAATAEAVGALAAARANA